MEKWKHYTHIFKQLMGMELECMDQKRKKNLEFGGHVFKLLEYPYLTTNVLIFEV